MKSFKQWLTPEFEKLLDKKLAQIKALNMREDADDICGIYPPEYEGIGNYPPAYFNSNIYIKDSLKNAKKRKKKHKKK